MIYSTPLKDYNRVLADTDLLARCLSGDRSAREDLARACLPRVRRTVMFMASGRNQDVDDLVQTAMARVFAGLHSFRGNSGFQTWLDRVTINSIRQYYRGRPIDALLFLSDKIAGVSAPNIHNPERKLEGQRLLERLTQHLSTIRPKKRIALVLSIAYGYTCQEAAELMDCSLETAKKRLQHGRRELLSRLHKDRYLSQALKEIEA
ncbi:MAG: RNA polymerase sigma factor [Proteobacteria bacterium]|nr:RNA polymerase sigma factor [Pseudomonadota bacterium]